MPKKKKSNRKARVIGAGLGAAGLGTAGTLAARKWLRQVAREAAQEAAAQEAGLLFGRSPKSTLAAIREFYAGLPMRWKIGLGAVPVATGLAGYYLGKESEPYDIALAKIAAEANAKELSRLRKILKWLKSRPGAAWKGYKELNWAGRALVPASVIGGGGLGWYLGGRFAKESELVGAAVLEKYAEATLDKVAEEAFALGYIQALEEMGLA